MGGLGLGSLGVFGHMLWAASGGWGGGSRSFAGPLADLGGRLLRGGGGGLKCLKLKENQ